MLGTAGGETTEDGSVIGYEEYHPYGTTAYRAKASGIDVSERRYRYTGMEQDEETGLGYHTARYYAGWLGRWVSADPIGLGGGGNRFGYVGGNPVGKRDPGGMEDPDAARAKAQRAVTEGMAIAMKMLGAPFAARGSGVSPGRRNTDASGSPLIAQPQELSSFEKGPQMATIGSLMLVAGGGLLTMTGVGAVAGAPMIATGLAVGGVGVAQTTANATTELSDEANTSINSASLDAAALSSSAPALVAGAVVAGVTADREQAVTAAAAADVAFGLFGLARSMSRGLARTVIGEADDAARAVGKVDDGLGAAKDVAASGAELGGLSLPEGGVRAPASRHRASTVTQRTLTKESNTVIDPSVNVGADVEAINAGGATLGRNAQGELTATINGRTYAIESGGTLSPRTGEGFTTLTRGGFRVLGILNKFGPTPQSWEIMNASGISVADQARGFSVWARFQ
jgi:RHS repeat-associated protein